MDTYHKNCIKLLYQDFNITEYIMRYQDDQFAIVKEIITVNDSIDERGVLQDVKVLQLLSTQHMKPILVVFIEESRQTNTTVRLIACNYKPNTFNLESLLTENSLDDNISCVIFLNLMNQLIKLHDANIVHGNLHPRNIMVNKDTLAVYFINFNEAYIKDQEDEYLKLSMTEYTYPELQTENSWKNFVRGDTYSLGKIGLLFRNDNITPASEYLMSGKKLGRAMNKFIDLLSSFTVDKDLNTFYKQARRDASKTISSKTTITLPYTNFFEKLNPPKVNCGADSDSSSSDDEDEKDDGIVGEVNCDSFNGLKNTNNSCYQDSVFIALFAVPNRFIHEQILTKDLRRLSENPDWRICGDDARTDFENRQAIQDEIINITNSIRKTNVVKTCSNIRKLFRYCKDVFGEPYHSKEQLDAGDFISYLFRLFNVNGVTFTLSGGVTNDLGDDPDILPTETRVERDMPPIIPIRFTEDDEEIDLRNKIIETTDVEYDEANLVNYAGHYFKRRIEQRIYTEAPYLVFIVNRIHGFDDEQEYLTTEINCPETLTVNRKELTLHAIVVHEGGLHGGHYTCYIQCKGEWYYYNDLSTRKMFKRIGSYKKMMKSSPNPREQGTLYFYS